MRTSRLIAVVTVLASVAAGAVPANPALATGRSSVAPSDVDTLAICIDHRYVVTGDGVAVRTAPGLSSTILRRKNQGDIVVVPCVPTQHVDGYEWIAVRLGTGGIGWMARIYLRRL